MEILDLREERDEFERALLKKHGGTLLTLRANFPGEDKRHEAAETAVRILAEEVKVQFLPIHEEATCTKEGYIVYLLIDEKPRLIKASAIALEEKHPLGRLVDLDVREGEKIYSRSDFDLPARKCYICNAPAVHCVRSMKHNIDEVRDHFIGTVENHKNKGTSQDIGSDDLRK